MLVDYTTVDTLKVYRSIKDYITLLERYYEKARNALNPKAVEKPIHEISVVGFII